MTSRILAWLIPTRGSAQVWLTTFSISTERCAWTVFMIYDAIIRRNLLVGPDCFYYLYFLLEIYFLLEYEGSSLPLVRLRDRCSDVGTCTGNPERQGLLTCGLAVRRREREKGRQTDLSPKGIYDRFPCREGWDFIRWSISNTQKNQNERTGKRGREGLCSAEAVIYISKCWNWEGTGRNPISVCFKHTDNFTQVNIHKNFTSIARRRETLPLLQLKDTKSEVL